MIDGRCYRTGTTSGCDECRLTGNSRAEWYTNQGMVFFSVELHCRIRLNDSFDQTEGLGYGTTWNHLGSFVFESTFDTGYISECLATSHKQLGPGHRSTVVKEMTTKSNAPTKESPGIGKVTLIAIFGSVFVLATFVVVLAMCLVYRT